MFLQRLKGEREPSRWCRKGSPWEGTARDNAVRGPVQFRHGGEGISVVRDGNGLFKNFVFFNWKEFFKK